VVSIFIPENLEIRSSRGFGSSMAMLLTPMGMAGVYSAWELVR